MADHWADASCAECVFFCTACVSLSQSQNEIFPPHHTCEVNSQRATEHLRNHPPWKSMCNRQVPLTLCRVASVYPESIEDIRKS